MTFLCKSGSENCVPSQGSVGGSKSESVVKFCVCLHFTDNSGRISSVPLQDSLDEVGVSK